MRKVYGALALVAIVGLAACDRPDRTDPYGESPEQGLMPAQQMDPDMMAAMMEIQEIQQKLGPIQQEALEDEALASQLQAINQTIDEVMREEDADLIDRIEGFQARMAAAEQAGDEEAIQALMFEAQGLQQEAEALQVAVLERPDIRQRIDEFEAAHRARMIEIDPEAEVLLDRVDAILAGLEG